MHKEIQIAPGVYLTDFRKDGNLIGLAQQKKQLTNDVGLLLDQVVCLQNKILQSQYSIKQIKSQQNWEQDKDFIEAIEQNWQYIAKFSYEMKEKVLRLFQLQYHPESQKIEQLLKINRIQQREQKALEQIKQQIKRFNQRLKQEEGITISKGGKQKMWEDSKRGELVEVCSDEQEQERKLKDQQRASIAARDQQKSKIQAGQRRTEMKDQNQKQDKKQGKQQEKEQDKEQDKGVFI